MAAGHFVNGVCVDVALSTDIYYSQLMPVFTTGSSGAEIYKVFASVNGVWTLDEYTIGNTGSVTLNFKSPLPTPSLASCVYTPAMSDPAFDYDVLANMWAFGISIVVALFVLGRGTGMILKLFKH